MKFNFKKLHSKILEHLTPVRLVVIFVVGVLFWFFVLGDQGFYKFRRLMSMKHKLTQEQKVLNDEIDSLTKEKEILLDTTKLEPVIRAELGYVRPGEVVFEERTTENKGQ